MPEITARQIAMEALLDKQGNVTRHLDTALRTHSLAPVDAGLATELALGVTRRRRTLDAIVRAYSDRPRRGPHVTLKQILRIGLYQLVYLDRVPDFAAVNEAVELCRHYHPRRVGYVNALLRNVSRGLGEPVKGELPLEADAIPLDAGRYRRLDKPALWSPIAQPIRYMADVCSLPEPLAARWLARAGSLQTAVDLAMPINARPPLVARVNRVKGTVADALAAIRADGVEAMAHVNGQSVVLTDRANVAFLAAFRDGLITPQDATATSVCPALDVRPGMKVLDFCAAPGTKTLHLAELMENQGQIVAVDTSEEKLDRVREGCQRCGADIVQTCTTDFVGSLEPGSFDRILVDAPCSNTGVLARRVEARWRFAETAVSRLAGDQKQILALAALFLSPSGRLVYSTCSIEPEENREVARSLVVRRHGSFKLLDEKLTLPTDRRGPTGYCDGGYHAILCRA